MLQQDWVKVAQSMGDKDPFQCAMIYNDQKDQHWFSPIMAAYGRAKRRQQGNKGPQKFMPASRPVAAEKGRGMLGCAFHPLYVGAGYWCQQRTRRPQKFMPASRPCYW